MTESIDIEQRLLQANRLLDRQDYQAAIASLCDGDEELGDHGLAWQLRGLAHFGLGDFEQATSALEVASILSPLTPLAQCRLAECYLHARRREVAAVIYTHLATLEILSETVAQSVADGLAKVGEHSLSLDFCVASLARFRGSHALLFTASEVMRRLERDNQEILPYAYQAHRLRPQSLRYRLAYARHLLAAGRTRETHRILAEVDLDGVQCVASLERLRNLFEQLGDEEGEDHCRARLAQIGYELSSSYRPPKEDR